VWQVLVATLHEAGRGAYSEPAVLEPSLAGGLPISSVSQPTASEDAEDVALEGTAWLLALIGSLTFMLLLIVSAMFYYRSAMFYSFCRTTVFFYWSVKFYLRSAMFLAKVCHVQYILNVSTRLTVFYYVCHVKITFLHFKLFLEHAVFCILRLNLILAGYEYKFLTGCESDLRHTHMIHLPGPFFFLANQQ
jgi:hypothetical protein